MRGESTKLIAGRAERDHPVTYFELAHASSNAYHPASTFNTELGVPVGNWIEQSHGANYVAEVKPRGVDFYLDFTGRWPTTKGPLKQQPVEHTWRGDGQIDAFGLPQGNSD